MKDFPQPSTGHINLLSSSCFLQGKEKAIDLIKPVAASGRTRPAASGLGQYNQERLPFMPQQLGHTGERPATAFKVADKRPFPLNKEKLH